MHNQDVCTDNSMSFLFTHFLHFMHISDDIRKDTLQICRTHSSYENNTHSTNITIGCATDRTYACTDGLICLVYINL